jgi:hypothetical protein
MDFLTRARTNIGLGFGMKMFNIISDPLGIREMNSHRDTNNTQIIYIENDEVDEEKVDEKKVDVVSSCKYYYTTGPNKGNICGRKCVLDSYCNTHEKISQNRIQNSDKSGLPLRPKKISYFKNKFSNYEIKNNGNLTIPRFLFDMNTKKIYGIQNNDVTCGALTNKHINICEVWNIEYRSVEETITDIIEKGNY